MTVHTPRLSILTIADTADDATMRAMRLTAKAVASQQFTRDSAAVVEWIVVHHDPETILSQEWAFPIKACVSDAVHAVTDSAHAPMVWLLPVGDTPADSRTVQHILTTLATHPSEDLIYGMYRAHGIIYRLQPPHLSMRRPVIPVQSCLIRRTALYDTLTSTVFDSAQDYALMLHILAQATRITPVAQLWVDINPVRPRIPDLSAIRTVWQDTLGYASWYRGILSALLSFDIFVEKTFPAVHRKKYAALKDISAYAVPIKTLRKTHQNRPLKKGASS